MGIPGGFNPRGEDWIGRKFAELEQQFRELAAANVFGTTGITPKDGGTDFDGYVNVNGPMAVTGEATVSGALEVTGTANFTGDTTIGGSATVEGDITKANSWGKSSLGPLVFGTGAPALSFTKNGATYQPAGIGLTRNGDNTADQVTIFGPHASSPGFFYLRSDQTFGIGGDGTGTSATIASTPGPNGTVTLYGGNANGSVNLTPHGTGNAQVNGNFAVTGSKAFIMDHPDNPDTMTLMHAATESDRNGVEYWGAATVGSNGTVTVELPGYFESLTKKAGRNVQVTPTAKCASSPWTTPVIDGQFIINAPAGVEVYWLVKAERHRIVDGHDELSFPVEQDKPLIGPQLPEATL